MNICEAFGGIVINSIPDFHHEWFVDTSTPQQYFQEFTLPSDFLRTDSQPANGATEVPAALFNPPDGSIDETITIVNDRFVRTVAPPLAGFQVLTQIKSGQAKTAAIQWTLEHYDIGGWKTLASGIEVGAHIDGSEVWFDIFFDSPVPIKISQVNDDFRVSVLPLNAANPVRDLLIIPIDGLFGLPGTTVVRVNYPVPDSVFVTNYGVIYFDTFSQAYFSHFYGVERFWFYPTYLVQNGRGLYSNSGPIQYQNQNVSMKIRILAGVANTGKDVVNNPARNVVVSNSASNLDTFRDKTPSDFWLSKPNPSQFGVETIYFDISQDGGPTVFDNIYLDPLTPGIYFNVYFSNDPDPGTDLPTWDALLWTHVPKSFLLQGAQNYAMPNPITAKYIAIEFTQLQAKQYDPGEFNLPIRYRKYPKWVLDYFVLRMSQPASEDNFVASQVQVDYDALSFAYNYYLDDIQQQPESFVSLSQNANTNVLQKFLTSQNDSSDQVDPATMNRISLAMQPFQFPPGTHNNTDSILSAISAQNFGNYPVETPPITSIAYSDVSSLDREALIIEKNMPVMFFYVTSRHIYREVAAPLTYNRAYFAGLKNVAFTRNRYTVAADDPLYIEGVGDNINVELNDFETSNDFAWVTHTPTSDQGLTATPFPSSSLYPGSTLFP